ncbi:MAG TPA: hypothetical protein VH008_36180 [Pseudonocardia sp.]|nr:hypothetical protein [Pseudonocardia sp.]
MTGTPLELEAALELTRTGDIWLFRGTSVADRAIRVTTNSPVNHVGMSVVIDDLPPLMWHAELGRSLPDMWAGTHQRGVQLHVLRDAAVVWANRYGQRGWLRQLDTPITREMEDGVLRAIARLDGTPFPSTARLASRWARGRLPSHLPGRFAVRSAGPGEVVESEGGARWREMVRRGVRLGRRSSVESSVPAEAVASNGSSPSDGVPDERSESAQLETAYCAEVVALTYQMMGLLPGDRTPNYYDPGRFWSGDELELAPGYRLGGEIPIRIPAPAPTPS